MKFLSGNQVLLFLHGLPNLPLMKVIIKISITGKNERSWELTPHYPPQKLPPTPARSITGTQKCFPKQKAAECKGTWCLFRTSKSTPKLTGRPLKNREA